MTSQEERSLNIPGENRKLDSKKDVEEIVDKIKACHGMISLDLSGNSFGREAAAAIADALSEIPTLQRALWSDMFVSRLKTEIPVALGSLGDGLITAKAHLSELDLSNNAFGPTGVEGVKTLLVSHVCYSLKILKFNNNGLGIGGGKILSRALLECHSEAEKEGHRFSLEVFHSGRNRLEDEGSTALAKVFETLGSLVEVSMPQNGIYMEGIAVLADAFRNNPNLQILNLSDNTFSDEGSAAIAAVLPGLQQLRVMNFGECLVRSPGASAIAAAIADQHQLLEELNLSFGEINVAGATDVIRALANKPELKKVDLNGNAFGEEGCERVREMMEANGHLEILESLSDDEGDEDEESDEKERDEEERDEEEHEEEEVVVEKENQTVISSPDTQTNNKSSLPQTVDFDQWVQSPSAEGLIGLGTDRVTIIRNHLGSDPSIDELAGMFVKVAVSYSETCESQYKSSVEEFIDCLEPCYNCQSSTLVNCILVQVGLIKSEDKKFKPAKEIEGPMRALLYLVRKPHFRDQRDCLIAFITKPNPVLDPLTETRHHLLSVLHTL